MTTLEDSFVRNPRPHEKDEVGGHDCFFHFPLTVRMTDLSFPQLPWRAWEKWAGAVEQKGWEPPIAPHAPQARTQSLDYVRTLAEEL